MKKLALLPVLFCLLGVNPAARAQSVATDPVGAVNITIKGNSDTIVAVPLTSNPNYSGKVTTTGAGGAANQFNLNVSGITDWTANQFANLYYVRMTSGAKNGMYYTVIANTATQLTVDTAGDTLSGIAPNDTFKVFKYWTLGSLFPPASAGTAANPLTASASSSPLDRRSQILVKNPNAVGINISASGFYYLTSSGWLTAGTNASADSVVLYPDNPLTVRQPLAVVGDVVWSSVGAVSMDRQTVPLLTQATGSQDNAVALMRPINVTLAQLGLESAFVSSDSTSPLDRRDQLLVYDDTVAGINKSAAKVYYRTAGSWRRSGADAIIADTDTILAGAGFTIRKYKSVGAVSAFWQNDQNY